MTQSGCPIFQSVQHQIGGDFTSTFSREIGSPVSPIWIAGCDNIDIKNFFRTVIRVPAPDCYYVVNVWNAMGGQPNAKFTNDTSCCTMAGVSCSRSLVTSLRWHSQGLKGSIPASIGNLKNLQTITFQYNQLSGKIPNRNIRKLTMLRNLDLTANSKLFGNLTPRCKTEIVGKYTSNFSTKIEGTNVSVNPCSG
jgi:hypothetical protein